MRMEAKVYMSHTDLARVQEAAKRLGMPLSGYMRWCALEAATGAGVPQYQSVLEGQRRLGEWEALLQEPKPAGVE